MRYRTVVISAALLCFAPLPAKADITGEARAIDGDTIEIGGQHIRLAGIDAPDLDQTCPTRKGRDKLCGQLAKLALARLIRGQELVCKGDTRDSAGRLVAHCAMGPFSLNEQLVADGWAMADPETGAKYQRAQTFAKARHVGFWKGVFPPPWEWRARHGKD